MKVFVTVGYLWLLQAVNAFHVEGPSRSSSRYHGVESFLVAPTTVTKTSTTKLHMYASVEEAIAEAQRICAMNPQSQECKVAWDIVEELEAADSHRDSAGRQSPLSAGPTNMSPDLVALVASFDILAQKIDGKMDQLMATSEKLQELGADDPAIDEMKARAANMREILAYVSQNLNSQV